MTGMRFHPPGYGGTRRDSDQVKRDGWHDQQMLAVSLDGKLPAVREVRNGR